MKGIGIPELKGISERDSSALVIPSNALKAPSKRLSSPLVATVHRRVGLTHVSPIILAFRLKSVSDASDASAAPFHDESEVPILEPSLVTRAGGVGARGTEPRGPDGVLPLLGQVRGGGAGRVRGAAAEGSGGRGGTRRGEQKSGPEPPRGAEAAGGAVGAAQGRVSVEEGPADR